MEASPGGAGTLEQTFEFDPYDPRRSVVEVSGNSHCGTSAGSRCLPGVMIRHISCRRERMRSPMRSPRVSARVAASRGKRSGDSRRRLIIEVCRNDGRAVVVIARIQDQADRIPDPFGRLNCSQFVQNQNVGLEHGAQERPVRSSGRWRYRSSESAFSSSR